MKMSPEETLLRIVLFVGLFSLIPAESVCPSGYTYNYNQCYRFESTKRRPGDVSCTLLTIDSEALRRVVWRHTESTDKGRLWVGATPSRWNDGQPIADNWWLPNEPNNSGGSEDCVEVWATGGDHGTGLNDLECRFEHEYACEAKVCYSIDNCVFDSSCIWNSGYFGRNKCFKCVDGYYSGGEGMGCIVCTAIPNCVAETCNTSTDQTCTTCVDNNVFFKLTNNDRNCDRMCSWNRHYCWPGSCSNGLTSNCQCTNGFRKVSSASETLCQPATYPEVLDCQTVYTGPNGEKKRLMSNSPSTHCENLQDTYGNFQPIEITYNMTSEFTIDITSLPRPKYITTEKFGITDTTIILRKLLTSGQDNAISNHRLTKDITAGENAQAVIDNNGVLPVYESKYNLHNGDALCIQYKAEAGGYLESYNYVQHTNEKAAYDKTASSETKCYRFDNAPPEHCSEKMSCQSNPLQLDQRVTLTGIVKVTFSGWSDPVPNQNLPFQASGIEHFEVRVSETIPAGDKLKVGTSIYYEEKFASDANTNFKLNLTVSSPKLFCVLFEVKDIADNVRQARRFVLSDSTSYLDVLEDNRFHIKSASMKTDYRWQTHLNDICLTWKERFYNIFYIHNPLLNPIEPDPHGLISGIYEQTDGILSVGGTPNVHGIVKYLVSWSLNGGSFAEPVEVQNFLHQNYCQSFNLEDGQSYTFIITAVDIASHTLSENRTVHIDSSAPHINGIGLIKDGFRALTVHNDRDLSTMDMYFEALDPHSGILNIEWSFGIEDTGEELGSGVLGVKKIIGDCSEENTSHACYCPDIGSCENNGYLVPLNKLVSDHKHLGDHHREYFFKIKATNIAYLSTTEFKTILVDYSPPEVGGISEGSVDDKDMDYTSEGSIMVHWYGFIDQESGISKYRIGFADRCLHRDELYNHENVSDIVELVEVAYTENNVRVAVRFTGKMYVSIIAFNNALDPSDSVCSDGITRDTTPPKFYNLTVGHSSIVSSVVCFDDQPWFLNSNLSLSKLPHLSECLTRCSETESIPSYVFALPKGQYSINTSSNKDRCSFKKIFSTDDIIYLPNDYIQLSWDIDASESQIDDYFVGIGIDRSESENPQLISYMSTNRRTFYKHRHEGNSPGEIFFIFLKAVSKSGLEEVLVIGPMLIDSTPPLYKRKPDVMVNDSNIIITWDEDTFYDLEQAEQITRIDYTFGLNSNRLEWSLETQQSYGDASCCCIKYPLTELQEKDADLSLEFYAKLFVYNNAGHFTEVNTDFFRIPSRYPPGEAIVYDLDPENIKQMNSDIDVHFKSGTLCASWAGFEKQDDISIEIGVGSISNKADIVPFQENHGLPPFCVKDSFILIDHKYHFLVKTTNSGGTTVSASDGISILDSTSLISKLNVNIGQDCARHSHLDMITVETTSFTHVIQFRVKMDIGGIFYISTNEATAPFLEFHSYDSLNISETSDQKRFYFTPFIERPKFTLSVDERASVQTIDLKLFRCQSVNSLSSGNGLTTHWTFHKNATVYNFWYEVGIFEKENSRYPVSGFEATHEMTHTFRNIKLQPFLFYRFAVKPCTDNVCLDLVPSDIFSVEVERPTGVIDLAELKSSPGKSCFDVKMAWTSFQTDSSILFYQWTISKDVLATHIVKNWVTVLSSNNNQVMECIEIQPHAYTNLFGCVKAFSLAGSNSMTCKTITVIQTGAYMFDEHIVYDLDYRAESWKEVLNVIHSKDLGDGYRFLHDSEIDIASARTGIAGAILGTYGRNVTWYLMTSQQIPKDYCFNNVDCLNSIATDAGYVIWPNNIIEMNKLYYICVHSNTTVNSEYAQEEFSSCSNGFVKDNEPPRPTSHSVSVTNYNGFITDTSRIIIIWEDFDDNVNATLLGYPQNIRSYSCGLGNKPGIDDIYSFTSVGHSAVVVLRDLYIRDGLHVYITVKATDYAGLESVIVSEELIVDTSPPITGTILLEPDMVDMSTVNYISTDNFVLHLSGFEDKESGISYFEVGVGTRMLLNDVLPLRRYDETSVQLQLEEKLFKDGNTYFINIMAINNAGLKSMFVTGRLAIDTSPPTGGHLTDGHLIEHVDLDFSSDLYRVQAYWKGFMDPHSMIHYYNVGFGTRPYADNIRRFRVVGLNQAMEWTGPFISGQKYYTTVEACNHAGLCRTLTSDGIVLDNTPPIKGLVKIGSEDFHHRFYPHSHWFHIHWTGFNDPQSGIDHYEVCVGTEVGKCDSVEKFGGLLQTNVIKTEVNLPVNKDLFASVTAYNRVGMNVSQTSESFRIDDSPPILEHKPRFLDPLSLDEEPVVQWEKSMLKIVWLFTDPESPIINNEITLFTHHEGHTPIEHVSVGAETTFTINLRASEWLHNGDNYFVKVTSCNAAGRCSTSQSNDLLIESTPPHVGGFKKPMKWVNYKDSLNEIKTNLTLAWYGFQDQESLIDRFYITVSRSYSGQELTGGVFIYTTKQKSNNYEAEIPLVGKIAQDEILVLTIWGENQAKLKSLVGRISVYVLTETKTIEEHLKYGVLEIEKHSCDIHYCNNDCTCAVFGQPCIYHETKSNCTEIKASMINETEFPAVDVRFGYQFDAEQTITASSACLSGNWKLVSSDKMSIERYEWSIGLKDQSIGEGIFDLKAEQPWNDVGLQQHVIYCLPVNRSLIHAENYILYVRAWYTQNKYATFSSRPIAIDQSPPSARRDRSVVDSDESCNEDLDFIDWTDRITGCWTGVFSEHQGAITHYRVAVGTLPQADDILNTKHVGLETKIQLSNLTLTHGTTYYFTVTAYNTAGLSTSLSSDGFTVDTDYPLEGIAFNSLKWRNREFQSSNTSMNVSWSGFVDYCSGIDRYYVAISDTNDKIAAEMLPFVPVALKTFHSFTDITLQHNKVYYGVVKASDAFGHFSKIVFSPGITIDGTKPSGYKCLRYDRLFSNTVVLNETGEVTSYITINVTRGDIVRIVFNVKGRDYHTILLINDGIENTYLHPVHVHDRSMTFGHTFIADKSVQRFISFTAFSKEECQIDYTVSRCQKVTDDQSGLTVKQIGLTTLSIDMLIADLDSGLCMLNLGAGTSDGGFQIQTLKQYHHGSNNAIVQTNIAHGSSIYVTVIAENCAGLKSTFKASPVKMDHTAPVIDNVYASVNFSSVNSNGTPESNVMIDASWRVNDDESGVQKCLCALETHPGAEDISQFWNADSLTSCSSQTLEIREGSHVHLVVKCVNNVELFTVFATDPILITYLPPDIEQVKVYVLPSDTDNFVATFDKRTFLQTNKSSVKIGWCDFEDVTEIISYDYRLSLGASRLVDWQSAVDVDVAVIDGLNLISGSAYTVEIKATNTHGFTSDPVSTRVTVVDERPQLTGKSVTLSRQGNLLYLDWDQVFSPLYGIPVSYTLNIGTHEGYSDVTDIIHMTTSSKTVTVPSATLLTPYPAELYIRISCSYPFGFEQMYEKIYKL